MSLRSYTRSVVTHQSFVGPTNMENQRRRFIEEVLQSADSLHRWLERHFRQVQAPPLPGPDSVPAEYVLCTLALERKKVAHL